VSKTRWSMVGVLVAAALIFIVWSMTDGRGSKPLSAALIAMHPDSSDAYIYPVWTTDGRTPLKLANVGGEMTLLDPVDDYIADPPVGVTLPGATGARPQAVAALPGQADGPWVAVARRHKDDNDDPQATDRPLVWHGHQRTSGGPSPAAGAVELPVDLFTKESEGADTTIDVAVARLGDLDVRIRDVRAKRRPSRQAAGQTEARKARTRSMSGVAASGSYASSEESAKRCRSPG
jgi:hypothetical protein